MLKHKIAVLIIAIFAITTFSVGASAATARETVNLGNNFLFEFNGLGGTAFTPAVTKNNSRTFAEYCVSGGSVSDMCFITIMVTSTNNTSSQVSETERITEVNGTASHALQYNSPAPGLGTSNRLCGMGSYHGARISGTWKP